MRFVSSLFVAALLITACKQAQTAPTNSTSPIIDSVNKELPGNQFAHPLGDPKSPFLKDGSAKPPFEEATVKNLNAIVGRSKAAIDAFDLASKEKTAPAKEMLSKWAAQAETARIDFEAAAVNLRKSEIYYDKPILSGMATFVATVEKELKIERDR